MHLPTTNGDHTTGDGIKLSQALGGATIDLPAVQVHPTGLVNPKEPDAKIKFLAAEALRGVGGLILDNKGQRFCNELGTRDYVTGEMWKRNAGPYRLVLNGKGIKEIEWHIKHYVGRGLMKTFKGSATRWPRRWAWTGRRCRRCSATTTRWPRRARTSSTRNTSRTCRGTTRTSSPSPSSHPSSTVWPHRTHARTHRTSPCPRLSPTSSLSAVSALCRLYGRRADQREG